MKAKKRLSFKEKLVIASILSDVYDNLIFDKENNTYIDNQNIVLTLSIDDFLSLKSASEKIMNCILDDKAMKIEGFPL